MKKIFAYLAAFAALTSCSVKELDSPERPAVSPILHASFEDGTEATKTYVDNSLHLFWTADDRLSVFLGTTYNQQYRFMGETGDNAGDFEEVPASGLHSGSDVNAIYAVYPYHTATKLSYGGKITAELPAFQQYAPGTFGLRANTMVAVTAGKSDTFLPFKNLCGYLVVKLYGSGSVNSVAIEGNNGEKLAGRATVSASHNAAPSLALADDATTSITIDCGEGVKLGSTAETATEFWFCIPPVTFSKGFTITAAGTTGTFSKSTTVSRTIERNVRVSMPALEFIPGGPAVPEMVDLGLPSGILWASFNLGASKPEEYGGYYQWGGLEDVTDTSIYLDWSNCPYHTGSSSSTGWTKYVPSGYSSYWSGDGSPDNKTVLDPEDDVAHVKLGGKWRMPTKAEFDELRNNCTSEWTTLNGVAGMKFTSKENGKSIFLPAASYRYYDGLNGAGSDGSYCSSSLRTGNPDSAYSMGFGSDDVFTGYEYRYSGQSVRPVYGDLVKATGISLNTDNVLIILGSARQLTASLSPSECAEKGLFWSSSNTAVAAVSGTGIVTAKSVGTAVITVTWAGDSNLKATCTVTVTDSYPVPDVVDLGLPSGIKWASFNLGASKPEEYGGYYQWGGLEDVTDTSIYLDWSNCPYHKGSDGVTGWTKYIPSNMSSFWSGSGSPDNKTVLNPEDDVAHVKLGSKWRMPTRIEFDELYNNCTSEWTTLNGVYGRTFTSKKNGNSIFLPAAGCRIGDYFSTVGSNGCYRSSSLYTDLPRSACYLNFASDDLAAYSSYRFYGFSLRPVFGDLVKATGISLNTDNVLIILGSTRQLTASLSPSECAEKGLFWSSSNTAVAAVSGTGIVTAKSVGTAVITVTWAGDSNLKATCTVTVTDSYPVPDVVDLGLPSGIKWASFNLGASKPEEYGGYYQWGGLEDVTDTSIYLDWSNCPYHTGSSSSTGWTKYIPSGYSSMWSGSGSPDNKTVLDPEDDVAHVKLGGKWRMPTRDELEELLYNCTSEWTTLNGVYGRTFTSKKNGNSIFLPAAGNRDYDNLYNVGSHGRYWFSSLDTNNPNGTHGMYFSSSRWGMYSGGGRCSGQSVRPVYGDKVSVTGVSLSKTSLNLVVGAVNTLSATVSPSSAAEQSVSWSSNNPAVATVDAIGKVTALKTGSATITVKTTDGGYTASCQVTVVSAGPAVPEAVDLGLPSGIKWASFNLGASKPEEYGGYYQWAGTKDVTDKSIYLNYSNCPYHTGSSYSTGWTKYVPSGKSSYWSGSGSPDNKTVLDSEDDVAHVKLGGKWRMPTMTDFIELYNNCTSEWTTLNGVKGRKFTSTKNGNCIFLPAAGYRDGDYLALVGSVGLYWSSSLYTVGPCGASELYFSTDRVRTDGNNVRYEGLSVRPVSE